ncbi:glycosyltransferase [Cohnella terricola]|nr:glycosyltransferase [Cohnella terricola]
MATISVCMIMKNEAHNLPRSLESIPSTYEVVVVDTGSSDSSISVARNLGAKVFEFPWGDSFSDARNYSIRQATGDYILILDADECFTENIEIQVKRTIENSPKEAATVMIRNVTDQDWTQHRMIRFFPNHAEYSYVGDVHESLSFKGAPARYNNSEIVLLHYGYESEEYNNKGKFDRNLRLYEKELAANPNNGYMWYQLGKLYYSVESYEQAYHAFATCADIGEIGQPYFPPMLIRFGYTLLKLGKSEEAFALITPFGQIYPDFPDLPFLLGLLSMETGRMQEIAIHFQNALRIGETSIYSTVIGVGSYKAHYNLGVYYEVTGDSAKARNHYFVANQQGYEPAGKRLMNIV